MPNRPDLYVPFIYFLTAIIYAWLGLFAWRKRPAVAVTPFAWTMLGMSIWSFAYGLEIFTPSLASKLLFTNIEYTGIVSIPVFLLIFSLEFIGKIHLLSKRGRLYLWGTPLLILVLVWTNNFHHLMWNMESVTRVSGLALLNIHYGTFFWIQVAYSYILVLVASLLLIIEMVQRPGVYRIQVSLIVIGILAPLVGSFIFIAKVNPIHNLDFTPLFFLPTGLGLSWAITRYRLLEIMPLEHLTVLKNMADGVIVINQNNRVLYTNPLIEELLGRSEAETLGQPLNYISKEYGEAIAASKHQSEIIIGEGSQSRVFEINIAPVSPQNTAKDQAGPDHMIVLHDITERKKTETALSRRETMMSAISLAAEQFLKESTWEHHIPGILEKIGQAANVSRIYIIMNSLDKDNYIYSSLSYEWSAPGVSPQINNPALQHINLHQSGFSRWEQTLSEGRSIYGLTRDFPEEEYKFFQPLGSISIAAMPIFVDNQWWGFIMFDENYSERHWTGTELETLHIAASIFGSAETRARTEKKLIRRQNALNLLHEIVTISLQASNVNDMSQIVVDRLGELINADGCFLALWDETAKRTIPLAAYGQYKDTYTSLLIEPGEHTITESTLNLGHTLIIEDTSATPYANLGILKNFPFISILVLPLMVMNRKFGSVLLSFDKQHHFQPEEISICEQASSLIALAFEKFQVVARAERRADTSETLRKAGAAITETLETDQTVARILEQLKQVIPYDTASVQILDKNELKIIGGSGFADLKAVVGMRFPVPGDNPNTIVIQTGQPYLLPEIGDVYFEFKKPPHNHIHSWLGVPLIFQDRIIGLLAIDSTTPNQFTQENIALAATFADQVSVALENSRIYEKAQNQAITDPLTGVYNRRGLFQIGEFEFSRSRRIGRPFCVMMLDIDHFKRVNDHYGHATGDQALYKLAERCVAGSRAVDLISRYGGEEFVILLPETHLESARHVAERLRQSILTNPITTDAGPLRITISIGVAEALKLDTLDTLIARADAALYKAKHAGRNCVML